MDCMIISLALYFQMIKCDQIQKWDSDGHIVLSWIQKWTVYWTRLIYSGCRIRLVYWINNKSLVLLQDILWLHVDITVWITTSYCHLDWRVPQVDFSGIEQWPATSRTHGRTHAPTDRRSKVNPSLPPFEYFKGNMTHQVSCFLGPLNFIEGLLKSRFTGRRLNRGRVKGALHAGWKRGWKSVHLEGRERLWFLRLSACLHVCQGRFWMASGVKGRTRGYDPLSVYYRPAEV